MTITLESPQAAIVTERDTHARLQSAIDDLPIRAEETERELDLLTIAKLQSRRELARLRKAKSRAAQARTNPRKEQTHGTHFV